MSMTTEQVETAPAVTAPETKPAKAARGAKRGAPVASKKGKRGKKASPAQKGPKAQKGGKKADSAREGSKASQILALLERPEGASLKELIKATGWQPHSVRGFLSGTLRKKMGLDVASAKKGEDGERRYSIKA